MSIWKDFWGSVVNASANTVLNPPESRDFYTEYSKAKTAKEDERSQRQNELGVDEWTPYYFKGLSGLSSKQREKWEQDNLDYINGLKVKHPMASDDELEAYKNNRFKNDILRKSKSPIVQGIFKDGNLTDQEWETLDDNISRAALENDLDGLSDDRDSYKDSWWKHAGDVYLGENIKSSLRDGAREYLRGSQNPEEITNQVYAWETDPLKKQEAVEAFDSLSSSLSQDYDMMANPDKYKAIQNYGRFKDTEALRMSSQEKETLLAEYMANVRRGGEKYANEELVNVFKDKMEASQSKLDVALNAGSMFIDNFASMAIGTVGIMDGLLTGGSLGRAIMGEDEEDAQRREGQGYLQGIFDNPLVQYSSGIMESHVYDMDAQKVFKELGITDNQLYEKASEEGKLFNSKTLPNLLGQYGFTAASTALSMGGTAAAQGAIKGGLWAAKALGMAKNATTWNKALRTAAKSKDMLNLVNGGIVATTEGAQIAQLDKVEKYEAMTEDMYKKYIDRTVEESPAVASQILIDRYAQENPEMAGMIPQGSLMMDPETGKAVQVFSEEDKERLKDFIGQDKEVKDYILGQYTAAHKDEVANDINNIRDIAEDGALADFAFQSAINGAVNMGLKATLHSKGVQKALQRTGLKKAPAARYADNVDVSKDASGNWVATAKKASRGALVKERLKESWGEGLEEYVQDVGSGFGSGYTDVAYEQYLNSKYGDEKGVNAAVEYSFIDALSGALTQGMEKAVAWDSVKDGILGGLSSLIGGFNVNQNFRPRSSGTTEGQNWFEKLSSRSPIVWRGALSPLINGTDAKLRQSYNDRVAEELNKFFNDKDVQEKLLNTESAMSFLRDYQDALDGKDELKARDAEFGQQFSVLNTLNALKGTAYYDAVMTSLDMREAVGKLTDDQIKEQLQDSNSDASVMLRGFKTEWANMTGTQDDRDFSPSDDNVALVRKAAKNATDFKNFMKDADEVREQVQRDFGDELDDDGLAAMMFQRLAIRNMDTRIEQLDNKFRKIRTFDPKKKKDHVLEDIALYGSVATAKTEKEELDKKIEKAKKNLADREKETIKILEKNDPDFKKSTDRKQKDIKKAIRKMANSDIELSEEDQKTLASYFALTEDIPVDERRSGELASAITRMGKAETPVLTWEQIISLSPRARAFMLNPANAKKYSKEQQEVIEDLNRDGAAIFGSAKLWRSSLNDRARLEMKRELNMRKENQLLESTSALSDFLNNVRNEKAVRTRTAQYEYLFKDANTAILEARKNGVEDAAGNEQLEKLADWLFSESDDGLTGVVKGRLFAKYEDSAAIEALLERAERLGELSDFLKMTDLVSHTSMQQTGETTTNEETGEVEPISQLVTTEYSLTDSDRKLLDYAIEYAARKGITMDNLAEAMTSQKFADFVAERNKKEANGGIVFDADYAKALVQDVVEGFNADRNASTEVTKPKEATAAPQSVSEKPVEPTGTANTREEERRPDEVDPKDPFGLKKGKPSASGQTTPPASSSTATTTTKASSTITAQGTASTETPAQTGTEEPIVASVRNSRILENARLLNGSIEGGVRSMLEELDRMQMDESTRNKLKDIIEAYLQSEVIPNVKSLQAKVLSDALTANRAAYPQIDVKATALASRNFDKQEAQQPKAETSSTTSPKAESPITAPIPMRLDSIDLDFFLTNPRYQSWADYIRRHNMVPFLQKFQALWNQDYRNAQSMKNTQVAFIYEPSLEGAIASAMGESGATYTVEMDAPVVMAIEINDYNRHLVDNPDQLIAVTDNADNKVHYYQPIGIMPSSNNQRIPTAGRMLALRRQIRRSSESSLIKYDNGATIKTNLAAIHSATDEESIPRSTEDTPKSDASELMAKNALSVAESFVGATAEEMDEYKRAEASGDKVALRKTKLWAKMKKAFVKRLRKHKPEEGGRSYLVFDIQKGTHDVYPKVVLTKAIGETMDRNSGRTIVELLRGFDGSVEYGREIVESNSRFKGLFKTLKALRLDKDPVRNISEYTASVESLISRYFNVPDLKVEVAVTGEAGNRDINIKVSSDGNHLATLTTSYAQDMSEAEFGAFTRDLILDREGNVRLNKASGYELVKWQTSYHHAGTDNKADVRDLEDLFDDGVLQMQVSKLSYPAKTVSAHVLGGRMSELYSTEEPSQKVTTATDSTAPTETTTASGTTVDADTGMASEKAAATAPRNTTPAVIRKAIARILQDSKNRNLVEGDERHYMVNGLLYSRVTSIKSALPGMEGRFDPASAWGLPSSRIGNSIDEFGRDVFNGVFDSMSEEERKEAFGDYDNSTVENYENAYRAFKAFEARLAEKGQTIIKTGTREDPGHITAAGVLNVKVNNNGVVETRQVRVAGTLDVLALDQNGNLHIYDFKTHRSAFDSKIAASRGYDRQLSMYAKFLEDEYGLKVASINIIPIQASYPAPDGIDGGRAVYKESRPGGNQLLVKDKDANDSSFAEYRGAGYQIGKEFSLSRLSGESLTASFEKMTEDEKASMVEAIQDQSEVPAEEVQTSDAIVSSDVPTTVEAVSIDPVTNSETLNKDHDAISGVEDWDGGPQDSVPSTPTELSDDLTHARGDSTEIEEHSKDCGGKR